MILEIYKIYKHRYKKEEIDFLKNNIKGITLKELTKRFNKQFNLNLTERAIANKNNKLGLSSGITNQFKKGNIPHNRKPIGSERTTNDGYVEIKTAEPNKWELKHRYIYKKIHGKIPDGYSVIFADDNKLNFDINNLILVSKSEFMIMNKRKLIFEDQNLTKTGHLIAKVISKTYNLKSDVSNSKEKV